MRFIAIVSVCLGLIFSCLGAPSQYSNLQQESARQLNFDFNGPVSLEKNALRTLNVQSETKEKPQQPFNQQLENNFQERLRANGLILGSQNTPVPTERSFDFRELSNGQAPGPQITQQDTGRSFDFPTGPAPSSQTAPQPIERSFDFPYGPSPDSQITPLATGRSFDFPTGPAPGSQTAPQPIERSFDFSNGQAPGPQRASQPTGISFNFQQVGIAPIKDFTGEFNILPLPKQSADILLSLKDDTQLSAILKGDANFIKSLNADSNASPLPKIEANFPFPKESCRFCNNILPLPKGNAHFSSGGKYGENSLPLPKDNVNFPPFPTGNFEFPSLSLLKGNSNFPPFLKENSNFTLLSKDDENSQPSPKGNVNFPSFPKGNTNVFSLPKSDAKLASLPEGDVNFLSFLKENPDFMASLLKMIANPLLLPKGDDNFLSLPKQNEEFLTSLKNIVNLPGPPNNNNLRMAPGAPSQGFPGSAPEQRNTAALPQGFPGAASDRNAATPPQGSPEPAPEQRNSAPLAEQVKDTPEVAAAREAHLRTVAETASKLSEPVKDTPEVMAAREAHLRIATNSEATMLTEPPKYTPEVQAAREAHFRAYALAAKLAMESDLNPKILEQLLGRPGEPKLGPQKIEEIFASLMSSPTFTEELKRLMGTLNLPMNIQVPAMNMEPPKESFPQTTDSRGINNLMEKPQLKSPIKSAEVTLGPGAPQPSASLRIPDAKLSLIDEFDQSKLKAASDLKCSTELKVKDLNNIKPTEERRFILIRTGELAPVMSTLPLPIGQSARWKNWGIQYMSL